MNDLKADWNWNYVFHYLRRWGLFEIIECFFFWTTFWGFWYIYWFLLLCIDLGSLAQVRKKFKYAIHINTSTKNMQFELLSHFCACVSYFRALRIEEFLRTQNSLQTVKTTIRNANQMRIKDMWRIFDLL